jgi:aspartyl-tRNA(Asn)/glutamyl-tRNA(Gln) amidotransferase subunit B
MVEYEPVIGLEVHAQLKTRSKIFCGCPTDFGAAQNEHVCPVCLGMPGVLPVLNKKVVEYGMRIGIALNCEVAEVTRFDRKNYFYPDLPKDYQISQYQQAICNHGHLTVHGKKIRILRAHLEEDAGKLVHAGAAGLHGSDYSLVDYNRTGVPLMEIVSEPDIENAEMARDYLMELRRILRYIDVCDGNLEEGSFRCDANVSIRPKGDAKLGTKAELKNMNSFSAVQRAIEFEIKRQTDVLNSGGRVVQETRLWNDATQTTHPMRSKEEAHDYRYFADPDLVPLHIDRKWVEEVRKSLPELPEARRKRYVEQNGLSTDDAGVLAESREMSDFFDDAVRLGTPPKEGANLLLNETMRYLKDNNKELEDVKLTPQNLHDLVKALSSGKLNSTSAKTVLAELLENANSVDKVIEQKGLAQISNESELKPIIQDVLKANQAQVDEYRAGDEKKKTKVRQFLIGQIMKTLKGRGNPAVINKLLDELLA